MNLRQYLSERAKSFGFAFKGIKTLISSEANARIHGVAAILVVMAAFILQVNATEWAILVLTIALVFITETLNTAVEELTNLVSPDYHPLAGKIKDLAAGAVLLAAIGAVAVAFIIFLPKLIQLL